MGFPIDRAVDRPEEFAPGLDPELVKLVQATAEIGWSRPRKGMP
jgi:Mn-containing catalase